MALERNQSSRQLTAKQRTVLSMIVNYYAATGEPCTVGYLTRRLDITRTAVLSHLRALRAKESLPPAAAPRVTIDA